MTTTDTNVQNLIINTLTKAEYESITPSDTELYMITDEVVSSADIATALGYTPQSALTAGTGISLSGNTVKVTTDVVMLDGVTGKIPNDRIAMDTLVTNASTNAVTSGAVYNAVSSKASVTFVDWTV